MLKNLKEVVIAILPMTLLIVILTFIFAPLDSDEMISFLFGAGIMMIGMTLFLFGADYSMMEVGRLVGKYMIKKKSLTILIALGFMIGIVITIAEPSVQVLGQQVNQISEGKIGRVLLIGIVSVGTGVFLAFALLRVVFKLSYYQLMAIGYVGVLVASFFTSNEFDDNFAKYSCNIVISASDPVVRNEIIPLVNMTGSFKLDPEAYFTECIEKTAITLEENHDPENLKYYRNFGTLRGSITFYVNDSNNQRKILG